jgi:hypothetical protein
VEPVVVLSLVVFDVLHMRLKRFVNELS